MRTIVGCTVGYVLGSDVVEDLFVFDVRCISICLLLLLLSDVDIYIVYTLFAYLPEVVLFVQDTIHGAT